MKNKKNAARLLAIGATISMAAPLAAQDLGRPQGSLTITQDLRWSDNIGFNSDEESGFTASTGLQFTTGFGTRSEQFSLSIGTAVDTDFDGEDAEFDRPAIDLAYSRTNGNASIGATLAFRESDVSTLTGLALDQETGTIFLIADEGIRRDVRLGLSGEFGQDAPFGGSFQYIRSETSYRETNDPDLENVTRDSLTGSLGFQINPGVRLTTGAEYSRSNADGDGTDTIRRGVNIGADFAISPALTAGLSLGYDEVETTTGAAGNRTTSVSDGFGLTANASLDLPNGSLSGRVSSRLGDNGRVSSLNISRNFDLKSGPVALSFGLTESEDGGLEPLYGVNYTHALKRGQLGVSLRQSYASNAEGDEAINSLVSVSYAEQLTPNTGLDASVSYGNTNALAGTIEDASRIDATVALNHALTRDWSLRGGYTYSQSEDDNNDTVSSNSVFVGIGRTFNWRY